MKLRKAKRFNTIESYASCVCIKTTCSCSCSCNGDQPNYSTSGNKIGQIAYETNHYDSQAAYLRG